MPVPAGMAVTVYEAEHVPNLAASQPTLYANTNVANTPYQPYSLPTVAELSPLQQQAYRQVQ